MESIAACVASRAAMSFVRGTPIEPDVSTITISAASGCPAAAPPAVPADPLELTVTIALTSEPSSGRYSFW